MERLIKKIVNCGIGFCELFYSSFKKIMSYIEKKIDNLVAKGESSDGRVSTKIKDFIEKDVHEILSTLKKKKKDLVKNIWNQKSK